MRMENSGVGMRRHGFCHAAKRCQLTVSRLDRQQPSEYEFTHVKLLGQAKSIGPRDV
jgi:hypothetical protein